jgi:hypothetical protein
MGYGGKGDVSALQAGGQRFEPVIAHQQNPYQGQKKARSGFYSASFFCPPDTLKAPTDSLGTSVKGVPHA